MSLSDQIVYRIYKCHNETCQGIIRCQQSALDQFKKNCPFCSQNSLLIENASFSVRGLVDTKKPKTLGAVSEINQKRREKEGKIKRKYKRPYWRKTDKINYEVLKNPNKYIETGAV